MNPHRHTVYIAVFLVTVRINSIRERLPPYRPGSCEEVISTIAMPPIIISGFFPVAVEASGIVSYVGVKRDQFPTTIVLRESSTFTCSLIFPERI
jgi:hypothetical protein